MERLWYFAEAGASKGPFSAQEMEGLLHEGRVAADTLVWRKGLERWLALRESELASELPPPLPDAGPRNETASSALEAQETRVALLREPINPEVTAPFLPRWIRRVVRIAAAIAISVNTTAYLFVAIAGAFAFRDTVVHQSTIAAYIIMGVWLVFALALLTWMVMLVRAANRMAPEPRQNRPWAVVAWSFVPLANFHKPYEIVDKALTRLRISNDAQTGFRIFWGLLCLGAATQMVGVAFLGRVNWGEVTSLAGVVPFWIAMAGLIVLVTALAILRPIVEMIALDVATEDAR